jgi:hypothetical protein
MYYVYVQAVKNSTELTEGRLADSLSRSAKAEESAHVPQL